MGLEPTNFYFSSHTVPHWCSAYSRLQLESSCRVLLLLKQASPCCNKVLEPFASNSIRSLKQSDITARLVSWQFFLPYPIWACFTPGSSPRHLFCYISFTTHIQRCKFFWGTWLRTLHGWRKVGRDREEEKSPAPGGIRTYNLKSFAPQACALPLCYNCNPVQLTADRNSCQLNEFESRHCLVLCAV